MKTLLTILIILIFAGLIYQPERGIADAGTPNRFQQPSAPLLTGDIILRRGKGFISEMFRKTSGFDQHYSHAGVIQVTDKGVFVVHVIGEPGVAGSNLRQERLINFCNSNANLEYAIYRYSCLSGKTSESDNYLNRLKTQPIRFDEQFDLHSDSALYCTELVYKMCLNAANFHLPLTAIKGHQYVALDNLYRNQVASLVAKQIF